MNEDLHTLSGAYALHALPGREGALFEEHLARCESCEDEVRGLRETAARLALAVAEAPPANLRPRVLAAIQQVRQAPPPVWDVHREPDPTQLLPRIEARRAPWRTKLALGLTAVAAAAAVALGAVAFEGARDLQEVQANRRDLLTVLAAPDAQTVTQPVTAGGTATVLLSRSQGRIVVTSSGLPDLKAKDYELWLMGSDGIRPMGLLRKDESGLTIPVLARPLRGDDHVGLTVEPVGGSDQPTTQPIMFAELPT